MHKSSKQIKNQLLEKSITRQARKEELINDSLMKMPYQNNENIVNNWYFEYADDNLSDDCSENDCFVLAKEEEPFLYDAERESEKYQEQLSLEANAMANPFFQLDDFNDYSSEDASLDEVHNMSMLKKNKLEHKDEDENLNIDCYSLYKEAQSSRFFSFKYHDKDVKKLSNHSKKLRHHEHWFAYADKKKMNFSSMFWTRQQAKKDRMEEASDLLIIGK